MTNTSTLWTTVKDELRERRERKEYVRRLRADLASYRTPYEVEDLLSAIDRAESSGHATADTAAVRRILTDNLREYHTAKQNNRHVAGL